MKKASKEKLKKILNIFVAIVLLSGIALPVLLTILNI
jgi:uncharacterized lipoprotein YajG